MDTAWRIQGTPKIKGKMEEDEIIILRIRENVSPSHALRCYQCGLYTDGVGSITPCINYTAEKHLKECPAQESHCIKYVSEGSTVRDCANECTEKESWGMKIYCCKEDGCNGSSALSHTTFLLVSCPLLTYLAAKLRQIL